MFTFPWLNFYRPYTVHLIFVGILYSPRAVQTEQDSGKSTPTEQPFMTVYVKTMTGKTMTLSVSPEDWVEELMMKIEEQDGTSIMEQRLLFNGLQLEVGQSLASYRVMDRSNIQLVVRQIGGSRFI